MVGLGFLMLGPCVWLVNQPKPFLMAAILGLAYVVAGIFSYHAAVQPAHPGWSLAGALTSIDVRNWSAPPHSGHVFANL